MTSWFQPLSAAAKERSDAARKALRPQLDALLQEMRSHGIKVRVVGSYDQPDMSFDPQWSDIDLLIEDAAGWEDRDLWRPADRMVRGVMIDIVMAEDLDAAMLGFMKRHAQELEPPDSPDEGSAQG